ncbi:hypothetical protein CRG98_038407 [Punica granatum]|uniref:Uncharacterized protein n=1 Tax=Punica granatum TaxID=22663 RepID=A0A2I0IB13_PUNGR|nr:hypothetical protein CRG98_038407 [Punica granatum]
MVETFEGSTGRMKEGRNYGSSDWKEGRKGGRERAFGSGLRPAFRAWAWAESGLNVESQNRANSSIQCAIRSRFHNHDSPSRIEIDDSPLNRRIVRFYDLNRDSDNHDSSDG